MAGETVGPAGQSVTVDPEKEEDFQWLASLAMSFAEIGILRLASVNQIGSPAGRGFGITGLGGFRCSTSDHKFQARENKEQARCLDQQPCRTESRKPTPLLKRMSLLT